MCGESHCSPVFSRRSAMVGAAAMTVTSLLPLTMRSARAAENALTPDAALASLLEGNARHVSGKTRTGGKPGTETVLTDPAAAVMSCADSPIATEVLFDTAPGELAGGA